VGRIVSTLKETGQIENTLVLYLQDNGGCAEKIGRGGKAQRQDKPTLPAIPKDAVVGQITRKQTREGFPLLGGPGVMPGPIDTFISYGENWANVSNTPFREYKHWVHEGGISTPLIAHWPAGIAAERAGKFERQPAHLIDIMATALDLAGAQPLADRMPPEGVSLRAAFNGKPLDRSAPIFFEHEGNRAVRDGKWKLVAKNKKPWELYDTEADRTELNDLAGSQPERVRTMSSQYEAWAQRVGAKPFPLQKKGAGKAKKKAAE
jgi:arylsulfatase